MEEKERKKDNELQTWFYRFLSNVRVKIKHSGNCSLMGIG